MNPVLLLILVLCYAAICLIISSQGRGLIKSREGFFLGGRSLGVIISATSVTMGVLSGLAFFGSPPLIMRVGSLTIVTLGFGVMGLVYPWYGYRLWKYGKERGYITSADFMRDRFESGGFAILVALLQLVFMIPYLSVQFIAIGNGLEYFTSISYGGAIVIFGIFLIFALFLGGAKGVGMMDVFNALLGIIVPLALVIMTVVGAGGLENVGKLMLENDPNVVSGGAGPSLGRTFQGTFSLWMAAFFAIMFSPHILSKMLMVKSRKTFQQMTIMGPLTHLLVCVPIVLIGYLGIGLYKPELTANGQSDMLVQIMMADYGNPVVVLFMLWALLAFSMSTANSFMVSCSAIVSNDLVGRYFIKESDPKKREQKALWVGKISVIVIMVFAAVFSLGRSMFITDYAYSLATPGFAQVIPALLLGLFWRRASKPAAIAGTASGLAVLAVTTFFIKSPLGISPILWATGINLILFLLISFATKPSEAVYNSFFAEEDKKINRYRSVKKGGGKAYALKG
jgi:SSS family solute:Na+ symporter